MARRRRLMTLWTRIWRRRFVRCVGAALALAALPLAWLGHTLTSGWPAPAHEPRLREVILRSPQLSQPLHAWVCLPLGYDHPSHKRRRYPVVYLLHGSPGQPRDWLEEGEIAAIEDTLIAAGE